MGKGLMVKAKVIFTTYIARNLVKLKQTTKRTPLGFSKGVLLFSFKKLIFLSNHLKECHGEYCIHIL